MKTTIFTYDGREYEVRAELKGDTWTVQVLQDGAPANKAIYTVSWDEVAEAPPQDMVAGLMHIAKQDFLTWSDWARQTR